MKVFLSKAERRRYYRNLRIKLYLYLGLVLLVGTFSVYLILNSSFFRIKKIESSEGIRIENARAEILNGGLARFLGFENFLSWPSEIGDIKVKKDYFSGTLKLDIVLPEKFAIWCTKECYWINSAGLVIESAPDTEGGSIPKINDSREFIPPPGKLAVRENLASNIEKIISGLNNLPIRVKDYNFNDRLEELTANGARGERLIFSVRFSPSAKAFSYLNDLILSGKLRTAEYVDLTVENRIYLKVR